MKIAIIVGHTASSGGAVKKNDGVNEFSWNSELARMISQFDPKSFKIFLRNGKLSYSKQISDVYQRVDDFGADAAIELHFNSVDDEQAGGTETFSSGSKKSMELAEEIHAGMISALNLRDRGVKIRNGKTRGRGYESLISGKAPAVLIEPFFGSNELDCKRADENKRLLAKNIYQACERVFGNA